MAFNKEIPSSFRDKHWVTIPKSLNISKLLKPLDDDGRILLDELLFLWVFESKNIQKI